MLYENFTSEVLALKKPHLALQEVNLSGVFLSTLQHAALNVTLLAE